jgi:putative ABC transport system ATP-binding protein
VTAVVRTARLGKDYHVGPQVVRALADVSITIEPGEFVSIMGQSGSGKSTLMNLLGCLDRPSEGSYLFDGTDVASLTGDALARLRNERIGFVFQQFNLLPRLSAEINVGLPLNYARWQRAKRRERVAEVLGAVGLADRAEHHPAQLSGGQQQRVAIARALVNRPSLLLADEPTGALDSRTGVEIMALFQELNRAGNTIVIVTHNPEVAQFTSRVMHFHDGRLRRDERVLHPADARAALDEMPAHDGRAA